MLKKIDAWQTSDGRLHECELTALDHETREQLRSLVRDAYTHNSSHPIGSVVDFLMNRTHDIARIVNAHIEECARIIDAEDKKP